MIHVFFVAGMFGTTVEYVLRSFTSKYSPVDAVILDDGSMHSVKKQAHLLSFESVDDFFHNDTNGITTPAYPFVKGHLPEILERFNKYLQPTDSCVLVYADDLAAAELNLLFQYHKIATGSLQLGLEIFCTNKQQDLMQWNKNYTNWTDMQNWELREWISIFYKEYVSEWINSNHQVGSNFLKIKNTELLFDTTSTIRKIFAHCNLDEKGNDLDKFVLTWQQHQQYIVDEYNLIDCIVNCTINQTVLNWKPLHVIAESIIQSRLRDKGFEIQCDGLNTFPLDSLTLYNLLEKC